MAAVPTLNSRLRVLVAKTYRAEKLYNSICASSSSGVTTRLGHGQYNYHSHSAISQLANDIRAREWQRSHHDLRIALNAILSQGSNSNTVIEQVRDLRAQFEGHAHESKSVVDQGVRSIKESARRHEFATIFKESADLIRHKARAHANQGIADELKAIIESSGRSASRTLPTNVLAPSITPASRRTVSSGIPTEKGQSGKETSGGGDDYPPWEADSGESGQIVHRYGFGIIEKSCLCCAYRQLSDLNNQICCSIY